MASDNLGAFGEYAVELSKKGFEVLPIRVGDKMPDLKSWTTIDLSLKQVRRWADSDRASNNVGIRTAYTPAVDIDVLDKEIANLCADWCLDHIGDAPIRQGRAPKLLLVYRTKNPFRKMSIGYVDDDNTVHKIEVLADGQQFVAYGKHPTTKKEYRWISDTDLLDYDDFELKIIDEDHIEGLFDYFAELCEDRGWTPKGRTAMRMMKERHAGEMDDDFSDFKPAIDIEDDELREALEIIHDPDSYDRWLQIGMALHHQFSGDDKGLEFWDEFSQRSSSYDRDELEEKWEGFGQYGGSTVTAKTIVQYANEAREIESKSRIETALTMIDLADDADRLLSKKSVKKMLKGISDPLHVEQIEKAVQDKLKELTGSKVRIATVREKLQAATTKSDNSEKSKLPDWCKHFVYVTQDDMFYDTRNHRRLTERAFNAKFNRRLGPLLKEGYAARTVLDTYALPVVDGYVYSPGESRIVEQDNQALVNLYNDAGVPEYIKRFTSAEEKAVTRVRNHFKIMFPDPRERALLISFFAYTVQNLNKRIHWAPLIYGGFGIGKSFFGEMMRAVVGPSNYIPANASSLKSEFSGWAEGRKVVVFEEIRQNANERYLVVEKIKPFITNATIDIRRMRTDSYSIRNVTVYILFTNHANAIPIQRGERRYFVLSPAIKTQDESAALAERDDGYYFELLFSVLEKYPAAIYSWLMDYKLHEDFNPTGHAPETEDRELMRLMSRDSSEDNLELFISENESWDLSEDLVSVQKLEDVATAEGFELGSMHANKIGHQLSELGYHFMGRARYGGRGSKFTRWWSKHPNEVKKHGLRQFIEDRRKEADEFDNDASPRRRQRKLTESRKRRRDD